MKNAVVFWFTGLSGAGKSTIAQRFAAILRQQGKEVKLLDGDDIRSQKHIHLTFSVEHIKENNRLTTQLCQNLIHEYDYILVCVITPFEESRQRTRSILGRNYVEVYVKASLETVIERDTKGLYKRALQGEIDNFIGISAQTPYEIPQNPDVVVDTKKLNVEESVQCLVEFDKRYVSTPNDVLSH